MPAAALRRDESPGPLHQPGVGTTVELDILTRDELMAAT
jgi:hypothetical protein